MRVRGEPLRLPDLIPQDDAVSNSGELLWASALELRTLTRRITSGTNGAPQDTQEPWAAIWAFARTGGESALLEEHAPAALETLTARLAPLALAEAALREPVCRIQPEVGGGGALAVAVRASGRMRAIRELARHFTVRAYARAGTGDMDGAYADCRRLLGIGRALDGLPFATPHLTRFAMYGLAIQIVERLSSSYSLSPAQLAAFAEAFAKEAEAAERGLAAVLRAERILLIESYLVRSERESETMNVNTSVYGRVALRLRRPLRNYRTWRALQKLNVLIDAAKQTYLEAAPAFAADEDGGGRLIYGAAYGESLAIFREMFQAHWRNVTTLRVASAGCQIAAECRRGAQLKEAVDGVPASLRTDPFVQEKDIRVVLEGQKLIVYSRGLNGRDDAGRGVGVLPTQKTETLVGVSDDISFVTRCLPVQSPDRGEARS